MKISEPTISHLLLIPGLSQWKITVCSLYYSSMVDTNSVISINSHWDNFALLRLKKSKQKRNLWSMRLFMMIMMFQRIIAVIVIIINQCKTDSKCHINHFCDFFLWDSHQCFLIIIFNQIMTWCNNVLLHHKFEPNRPKKRERNSIDINWTLHYCSGEFSNLQIFISEKYNHFWRLPLLVLRPYECNEQNQI